MSKKEETISFSNPPGKEGIRIACCQFGFEFENLNVLPGDYEKFKSVPPGNLEYYIYKRKRLGTLPAEKSSVKIKESDLKFGILDYDAVLNPSTGQELFRNRLTDTPDAYEGIDWKQRFKDIGGSQSGVVDDVGCYEVIGETNLVGIKFFSYIIEYNPVEISTNESKLGIYSPEMIRLIKGEKNLKNRVTGKFISNEEFLSIEEVFEWEQAIEWVMRNGGKKESIRVLSELLKIGEWEKRDAAIRAFKKTCGPIVLNDLLNDLTSGLMGVVAGELDKERVTLSLRYCMELGILQQKKYSLNLGDDAVVKVLKKGSKWGIINSLYHGYAVLSPDRFFLLDKYKFEMKSFPLPEELSGIDEKEVLIRLTANCKKHSLKSYYPLSAYWRLVPDKRRWSVCSPGGETFSEYHILSEEGQGKLCFKAEYLKVQIRDPDYVIGKIRENLLTALLNNVNVLCFPELSFFLPQDKLKKMFLDVVDECRAINEGAGPDERFRFSDILILTTNYFKYARFSDRHVNLGVGFNVIFEEDHWKFRTIKLFLFQKHIYSPVEYSRDDIAPGDYRGVDGIIGSRPDIYNWFHSSYWDGFHCSNFVIDSKTDEITVIRSGSEFDFYPLICADFIASGVYGYDAVFDRLKKRIAASKNRAIILILANSSSYLDFYKNCGSLLNAVEGEGELKSVKMVLFSNRSMFNGDYGRSFIFHRDMLLGGQESIDFFHFDSFRGLPGARKFKHASVEKALSDQKLSAEMIMAAIDPQGERCDVSVLFPQYQNSYLKAKGFFRSLLK